MLTHCMKCGKSLAAPPWWRQVFEWFGSSAKNQDSGGRPRRASIAIFVLGHECVYTYCRCRSCGFYSVHSYWDCWDGKDPVKHLGPFPAEVGDRCVDLVQACPSPMDRDCECDSHKALYYGTPSDAGEADTSLTTAPGD